LSVNCSPSLADKGFERPNVLRRGGAHLLLVLEQDGVAPVRTVMTRKTRATMAAGLAILVAGAGGAIFLGTRHSPPSATGTQGVRIFYAAGAVPSGTAGATALADGRIRDKTVNPSAMPANPV